MAALKSKNQGPYSQHFIFFVTYEWAPKARLLHYTGVERLFRDKNHSLLSSFVSCKNKEVL
jgi:hypothetical protein